MRPSPGPERTGAQTALGASSADSEREQSNGAEPASTAQSQALGSLLAPHQLSEKS